MKVKSTREKILYCLLRSPWSTIQELADSVGINPISVRHHITRLQAEKLVTYKEVRHGIGRPRLVYSLTVEGQEHFPTHYLPLVNRLLNQINRVLPKKTKDELFQGLIDEISGGIDKKIYKYPMDQKLLYAKELLAKEGFIFEWNKVDNEYHLREISCPYFQISQNHPEMCSIGQAFISNILNTPVMKVSCIRKGDQHCTYVINHY